MDNNNNIQSFFDFSHDVIAQQQASLDSIINSNISTCVHLFANLKSFLSFEEARKNNMEEYLKDAFCNNYFRMASFGIGSPRYVQYMQNFPALRNMKDGEIIELKLRNVKEEDHNYQYIAERKGDIIKIGFRCNLIPNVKDFDVVVDTQNLKYYDTCLEQIEAGNEDPFFQQLKLMEDGSIFVGKQDDGSLYFRKGKFCTEVFFKYDTPYVNFFEENGFHLFDQKGNEIDLTTIGDYQELMTNIRNYKAHNPSLTINKGTIFAGEIVFLEDGTTAVYSIGWLESFQRTIGHDLGKTSSFYRQLYMPNRKQGIKTQDELKQFLNDCQLICVKLFDQQPVEEFSAKLENIVKDYSNMVNTTLSVVDYINARLLKEGIAAKVFVDRYVQYDVLLKRLEQSPKFYKMDNKPKENIKEQKSFLVKLIRDYYRYDIIKSKKLSLDTRYQAVRINPKSLMWNMDRMIDVAMALRDSGKVVIKTESSVGNAEQMISLAVTTTFANLINNQFYESIRDFDPRFKKEDDELSRIKLRTELAQVDMNTFEMREVKANHIIETKSTKTMDDKILLLTSIRNAIMHGNIRVKFDENQDYLKNELYFTAPAKVDGVFYYEIKVSVEDLYQFFSQSLFAEYQCEGDNVELLENDDFSELILKCHPSLNDDNRPDYE